MSLSITQQTIGEVAVLQCNGRIVEGNETAALDHHVRDLQVVYRYFVLDLHEVGFVDSAGLGLLVRLLSRLRRVSGDLKLCGVAPNIQKSLNVSRLSSVLPTYDGVDAAVAAFERPPASVEAPSRDDVDILCVHRSNDVLAYLHELLRRAGYGLMTSTNVSDAATLLVAAKPRIVVIDSQSCAIGMSGRFGSLIGDARVIELSPTFSIDDAGMAGQRLLDDIARVGTV